MQEDGTTGALATVITDSIESMKGKLQRLVRAREEDEVVRKVLVGLHIEGPFLNQADGFIGAHPRDWTRPATVDAMKELLEAAGDLTRIVTLAPECDEGFATTRFLAGEGIVVSAGHCDPSLDQLRAAIDAGLSMFTHLGNGCPMQLQRHDNIVERVLSLSEDLWICFIGDGVHVPPFALRELSPGGGNRAFSHGDRCDLGSTGRSGEIHSGGVGFGNRGGHDRTCAGWCALRGIDHDHARGGGSFAWNWSGERGNRRSLLGAAEGSYRLFVIGYSGRILENGECGV